jgi:hypothetical protein
MEPKFDSWLRISIFVLANQRRKETLKEVVKLQDRKINGFTRNPRQDVVFSCLFCTFKGSDDLHKT